MTVALVLAAGSGERLGAGAPKAGVELAGRPLMQWSIDALRQAPSVERIVVALPPGLQAPDGVTAVAGGAARSQSVRRALAEWPRMAKSPPPRAACRASTATWPSPRSSAIDPILLWGRTRWPSR